MLNRFCILLLYHYVNLHINNSNGMDEVKCIHMLFNTYHNSYILIKYIKMLTLYVGMQINAYSNETREKK